MEWRWHQNTSVRASGLWVERETFFLPPPLPPEYVDIGTQMCGTRSWWNSVQMYGRISVGNACYRCYEKQWTYVVGIIIFNLRTAAFKAYCAIWVRRSNFRHQASPRASPREGTQRRKVKLWARNVREFCLNIDFHITFRDFLHAVKLRHGTDGFTSPPKGGVLRIFSL
jgi:hypothetical protein